MKLFHMPFRLFGLANLGIGSSKPKMQSLGLRVSIDPLPEGIDSLTV